MSLTLPFLPYGRQTIDSDDVAAVGEALRDDFLTTGPRVEEFERAFAEASGAVHAISCNSGTAALHLAALALDLGPGRAAIVPSMTFLATANAVRMTGADVVFADVDPNTGLMTEETFLAAYAEGKRQGRKMVAACPVHLNGQLCDMGALSRAAQARGLDLIEDACHALGVPNVGGAAHSRMACFSTHPVKAVATGEGGVVTTADEQLARRMRHLRSHGMTRERAEFELPDVAVEGGLAKPWYYEMSELGWNYRMPDVLCALGISQLKKLSRFFQRRLEIVALYDRLLAPLAPVLQAVPHGTTAHGWHLYAVLIDFSALGTTRARVMQELRASGIGTQVHYIPVHQQPYYRRLYGEQSLPGAEAYYRRCLSIPLYPSLRNEDVERIAGVLADIVRGKNAS